MQAHPERTKEQVGLLSKLADTIQANDVRAARPVRVAALRLAHHIDYRNVLAEALLNMADYHVQLAQYDSAATYLRQAEQEFKRIRDLGGEVRCLGRLGRIADQQGEFVVSLDYTFRALALATTGNTRRFNTSLKIQLATTYAQVGDYAEARRYLRQAQWTAKHWDYPDRLNLIWGELGEVSRQQHQWAAAQEYFTRSIAISRRLGEAPHVLAMQLNLARLAEDQGRYAAAAAQGQQVLARIQAAHLPLLLPPAQALLARAALHRGQVAQAVAYGRQSLRASQEASLLVGIREASAVLADAYTRQRAYALALAALRQFNNANERLVGEATRRRTALLQVGQQQREQQDQIRLLTQQNRLQAQTQELIRLRAQRQLIGLSALTLLALLLAGGALWQYRPPPPSAARSRAAHSNCRRPTRRCGHATLTNQPAKQPAARRRGGCRWPAAAAGPDIGGQPLGRAPAQRRSLEPRCPQRHPTPAARPPARLCLRGAGPQRLAHQV
ncbi:tetratricopeptide repeat protein [Hymenobacter sp. HMF4947]|uniref:Tetratricopeptide repeat protein n=1 Tax=Hymenobacter ginkgonis TaxID=2682976 RepID=A0A7K1T8G3_9BACT|nr:tetratricopeptide repeat protein [Hymenobacter ginkgonis]MVN74706.1 tetratricopeptide repeat protein [Hymenobacter ginkgonis]